MKSRRFSAASLALFLSALAFALAGCGDSSGDNGMNNPPPTPSITATNQALGDLSTVVNVPGAVSVGPGWVVIHENAGGSPGPVIGWTAVPSGTSSDIDVVLDRPAVDAETLHAMLHIDAGTIGSYEFPGPDAPAVDQDEAVVVEPLRVGVAAGTPAVRLRVTAIGTSSYNFTSAEPTRYANAIGPESGDETITLRSGWRYEIVNSASGGHPFELIAAGISQNPDAVRLSQQSNGSLEADVSVAWSDDGNQTIRFTASTALQNAVDGYRCSIHTTTMRGEVEFE